MLDDPNLSEEEKQKHKERASKLFKLSKKYAESLV
jgi:aminoglycoside phosphotransferase family enzyme